ncbi:MAG: phosphonate transport system permease protein [Planctomycetota bacterium]|jgi:phosphonate transport system permease protein
MSDRRDTNTKTRLEELWRERPCSRFLQVSLWIIGLAIVVAWSSGVIGVGEMFTEQRARNLTRFIDNELTPYPLRDRDWSLGELAAWAREIFVDRGWEAMSATLWIALLAIVLAGIIGLVLAPLGAMSLSSRDPYLLESESPGRREAHGFGSIISGTVRIFFIALRAIPEYIWAYLFLAMLGSSAWPAVLALAIHNAGILGRLGSDTIENLDRSPLRSLRMLGADRTQLAAFGVFPLALPRYLLYFFYRFETCVREATVLGMLGVVSLGYWISDARARGMYDEMLLLVGLGALLVLLGDISSQVARGVLRRGV